MVMKLVRVAVAIDRNGDWCAAGWTNADDADKADAAREHVGDGERIYFISAQLELPVDVVSTDVPASVEEQLPQRERSDG